MSISLRPGMEQWAAWRCESEDVMTALAEAETGLAGVDALAGYVNPRAVPASPCPLASVSARGPFGTCWASSKSPGASGWAAARSVTSPFRHTARGRTRAGRNLPGRQHPQPVQPPALRGLRDAQQLGGLAGKLLSDALLHRRLRRPGGPVAADLLAWPDSFKRLSGLIRTSVTSGR